MWAARKAKLRDLKVQVVLENDWANLSRQHKKIIVGAQLEDFTESDWEALGLGDEHYIGDYNYNLSIWERIKRLFG